jgi:hypothetical protein
VELHLGRHRRATTASGWFHDTAAGHLLGDRYTCHAVRLEGRIRCTSADPVSTIVAMTGQDVGWLSGWVDDGDEPLAEGRLSAAEHQGSVGVAVHDGHFGQVDDQFAAGTAQSRVMDLAPIRQVELTGEASVHGKGSALMLQGRAGGSTAGSDTASPHG